MSLTAASLCLVDRNATRYQSSEKTRGSWRRYASALHETARIGAPHGVVVDKLAAATTRLRSDHSPGRSRNRRSREHPGILLDEQDCHSLLFDRTDHLKSTVLRVETEPRVTSIKTIRAIPFHRLWRSLVIARMIQGGVGHSSDDGVKKQHVRLRWWIFHGRS